MNALTIRGGLQVSDSKNEYLKTRDKLFIILLLTLIIDVICLTLAQVQGIVDYNFTLHEMLFIPINLSIISVPIELIILIYYSTRYFQDIWKATMSMNLKYKIRVSICIICMLFTIGLIYYQLNIVKTSVVHTITNKLIDGNSTYIIVNSTKLKCTKNEYALINVNEEYFIDYNWNQLKPNVGKLDGIRKTKPYKK
mgnify:CR=1 FL=1